MPTKDPKYRPDFAQPTPSDAGEGGAHWPERLTLRDTKVFADEGQRIYTTATGYGYEKREYVRADLAVPSIRPQAREIAERLIPQIEAVFAKAHAEGASGFHNRGELTRLIIAALETEQETEMKRLHNLEVICKC